MSRLIVKDLPSSITESELRKRFSEKGTVTECSLKYSPEGVFRKFAFVGFKEKSEAEEAVRYFNNSYINASKIKVSFAQDFKDQKSVVTWSKHSKQQNVTQQSKNSEDFEEVEQVNDDEVESSWAIKVTGLPVTAKKSDVEDFFKPIKCFVEMGKNNKITAKLVVRFESEKDREDAMRRNKNYIGEKKIFLHKFNAPPPQKVTPRTVSSRPVVAEDKDEQRRLISETGRLFVRNLSYCCTAEDLEQLFSTYGQLDVQLQIDKFKNEQKGFALINYVLPENALAAYEELDGTHFQGRMLHIVAGQPKKEENVENIDDLPFSKKKELLKKKNAAKAQTWNTLFIGSNAVAEIVAKEQNKEKRDILMEDDVAAKMAIEQTKLVNKIRQFLLDSGVSLDSFSQASAPRSKSVILVKNLPAGTKEVELREVFKEFDKAIEKIIIPPLGLTALVKFNNEIFASQAFKDLIYTRLKHLPLYLEWAPVDVLSGKVKKNKTKENQGSDDDEEEEKDDDKESDENQEDDKDEEEEEEDVDLSLPRRFVFVKNIPREATEDEIKEEFQKCGKVVSVKLMTHKGTNEDNQVVSAFVEYGLPRFAEDCIRNLNGKEFQDMKLEMKISDRKGTKPASKNDSTTKKKKSKKKLDSEVTTNIIVKNVPFEATRRDLEKLFSNFSGVNSVRLPRRASSTGAPHKGFAFVEFDTKLSAKHAFDQLCHNTTLIGRRLVLEWSSTSNNSGGSLDEVAKIRKRTAEKFGLDSEPNSKKRKQKFSNDLMTGDDI